MWLISIAVIRHLSALRRDSRSRPGGAGPRSPRRSRRSPRRCGSCTARAPAAGPLRWNTRWWSITSRIVIGAPALVDEARGHVRHVAVDLGRAHRRLRELDVVAAHVHRAVAERQRARLGPRGRGERQRGTARRAATGPSGGSCTVARRRGPDVGWLTARRSGAGARARAARARGSGPRPPGPGRRR